MRRDSKIFRIISVSIIAVFLSEKNWDTSHLGCVPFFSIANPDTSLAAKSLLAPNTTVGRSAGKSGPGFIDITAMVSLKEGKDGIEVNIRRFPPRLAEEFLAGGSDALGQHIRDAREKGHKVYASQVKIGKRPLYTGLK